MAAKQGVLPLKQTSMGTVTSVAGMNANGFTVSVANPTTTPTITIGTSLLGLMVGDGTAATALPFPGGTTTFLRADGAFATPASGGTGTVTNTGTLTANQLIIGNGTVDVKALGSLGTTTTVLHGNAAGAPTYGAVSLTADVSGTLPIANGGTNSTATATAGGIGYGTGAAHAYTAAGTAGQVVLSGGAAAPTFTTGTLALAGNLATSGAFASTFTMTGTTTVTFPTSGTLLSTAAAVTVAQGGTSLTTLTANNVILGNGTSAPTFVAPSTSGNVLTSNGTTWQSTAPTGVSGLVCIATATVSSAVATVDFTSVITSTYERFQLDFVNVVPSSDDTLQVQLSDDNGATWHTSYFYSVFQNTSAAGGPVTGGTGAGASTMILSTTQVSSGASSAGANGTFDLFNAAGISAQRACEWSLSIKNSTNLTRIEGGAIDTTGNAAINALRVKFGSNNIAGGVMHLYGYRKTV